MFEKIKAIFSIIGRRLAPHKQHKQVIGTVKYFCIGRNKTGTTSLGKAFENLGFVVGDQREAEELYDKYFFNDQFDPIVEYCKTAEVFQDVPFSYFKTLEHVDKAFPESKFILTIRDDANQWYESLTKFHAKKFGKNGRIPTASDLENSSHIRKGFMRNTIKAHGTSSAAPYDKEIMCNHYIEHNENILKYFNDRPEDLLVINLLDKDAYKKFIDFLDVKSKYENFPWENKT